MQFKFIKNLDIFDKTFDLYYKEKIKKLLMLEVFLQNFMD